MMFLAHTDEILKYVNPACQTTSKELYFTMFQTHAWQCMTCKSTCNNNALLPLLAWPPPASLSVRAPGLGTRRWRVEPNQPANQPNKRANQQPTYQPTRSPPSNQVANQTIRHPGSQTTNQSSNQTASQTNNHPKDRTTNKPREQPSDQRNKQPMNQLASQPTKPANPTTEQAWKQARIPGQGRG